MATEFLISCTIARVCKEHMSRDVEICKALVIFDRGWIFLRARRMASKRFHAWDHRKKSSQRDDFFHSL